MADVKISALPSATTPLTGAELVPVVQSGVTDQVSVANLTAGRAVAASTVNVDANTASAAVRITQIGAGNALVVEDSASPDATPFVVDASGIVMSVNSTAIATQTGTGRFQTATISAFSGVAAGATATDAATIDLARTRGTAAAPTIVSSGDSAGRVSFGAYDGSAYRELGKIEGVVDGTPGANDMPGRLVFSTTADGASTPTEWMRINNIGFTTLTGSFGRGAPVTKTGNFTLAATENWVICNGASTITVTLPAAASWTGREVMLKTIAAQTVVSATANILPLASATPGTAILAATAGKWATLVSDGTNWVVMAAA